LLFLNPPPAGSRPWTSCQVPRIILPPRWINAAGTAVGAGAGTAVGAGAALATSRLLQGLVFGVSATDPTTYVVVIGLVLASAVLASLLPALRASRTDPVALFRAE
ncbi:MAG: hypothetical protein IH936_03830, partial [Acidobacteria bacterium]|nr:hypothetical protein [Acidobacteriota bacterium]